MTNRYLRKCIIAAAVVGLGGLGATAQASEGVELGKITVKGEAMREADRSFTVNMISRDDIADAGRHWENPFMIMETIPGVNVRALQSGSVADFVMVRGMAGGGHVGDLGFSLDGISLNESEGHSDGYADTQVMIPLEMDTMKLYKGPVSPLYGNFARGGVMAVTTRKGGEYTDVHLAAGSYDTYDAQAAFGGQVGPVQVNGALQGYDTQGWRDHNRFTKMNAALRGSYNITEDTEIALSLRGHGAWFEEPRNIPKELFDDSSRRHTMAPNLVDQNDGGQKWYNSQRLDLNHNFNPNLRLLTWYYQTDMHLTRFQSGNPSMDPDDPAGQTERVHDREVMAIGASLNGMHAIGGIPANWVFGVEYYDEETHEDRWATDARVRINRQRDRDFETTTTSVYGQIDLDVNPLFRPTLGFRYDDLDQSGVNLDPNLTFNDYDTSHSVFTPKLGVRSAVHDNWELRASYSEGFATAGIDARDAAADLDLIKLTQYEIGVNATPTPEWYIDVAAFILDVTDDIQFDPVSLEPFNAGETQRIGLEADIRYFPAALEHVVFSAALGFFDTEIKRDIANPQLEGNELNNVPDYTANLAASYSPPSGWGGSLRWRSTGSYYTSTANTAKYDGFNVIDASVFYTMPGRDGRYARIYMDINNLNDEVYARSVGGDDGAGGPSNFNPRPPTNVMLGFQMYM